MNLYHVKMTKSWRGPSNVSLAITVGETRAMVSFNKAQEDPKAVDYPHKKLWLQERVAQELKQKGFDVRKASTPKPPTVQVKPKRQESES